LLRSLCGLWGVLVTAVAGSVSAGVVTDGTVGPRVHRGGDFEIGADLGRRAGRNLFHSFERFSLDAGERATFSGPDDIRNVISRVTGGARSDIDGTIASTIPGADFYFLNPAGVMFGPNASLDVQGSFHVSTADELRFADGARFSAIDPAASSFTVAAPEAFGSWARGGPRSASIAGDSSCPQARLCRWSEAMLRSAVALWRCPGAHCPVELGRAGRSGAWRAAQGGAGAVRGAITMTDEAQVNADGQSGGGSIAISGGRVLIRDFSFVDARGSEIGADGGEISIVADEVTVDGSIVGTSAVFVGGNAGATTIAAGRLDLVNGSVISSGGGGGGDIALAAGSCSGWVT
jgi:filamentous hemagglutinin family protein